MIFTGYLFIAAIIMYSSRTATAVAAVTLLIYSAIMLKKNFSRRFVFMAVWAGNMITTALMYYFSLALFNRYSELREEMKEEIEKVSDGIIKTDSTLLDNSASSRILAWRYSFQIIKTNWLTGVGTGDIKDELVKKYNENGWNFGAEKKLNPHNQYLHTFLLLGIPGFILLMLNILFPFYFSLKQKHWIYSLFIGIIFLNSLTESVLEVQRGILLFPFFSCLFYNAAANSNNLINH
jgi:O-antigen ligase